MDIQNILNKFAKKLEAISTEDLQSELLSYSSCNSEITVLEYLRRSNSTIIPIKFLENFLIVDISSPVSILGQDSSFFSNEVDVAEDQYQYYQAA
ncbi:hypothetical protein ACTHR3_04570 [Neisseria sp. P0005.S008]|jgi:hypothetical protein|uniref:hypothetical protein n=1 Tax=Neisseria sp. P0005.S008 TaxID=3436682 RepID=UPI003F80B3DA